MNHIQLHKELSEVYYGLKNKTISTKEAKEFANIAGKIINNSKGELAAIAMGHTVSVPLLGITEKDVEKVRGVVLPVEKGISSVENKGFAFIGKEDSKKGRDENPYAVLKDM